MTTKQDYINSILQSLAAITLSEPNPELFAEIDRAVGEFHQRTLDPQSRKPYRDIGLDDAVEILGAFAVDGFYDAIDDKSRDDADWGDIVEDEGQDFKNRGV